MQKILNDWLFTNCTIQKQLNKDLNYPSRPSRFEYGGKFSLALAAMPGLMKFIHTRVLAGHQRIKRYTIALPGTKAFRHLTGRFGGVKQKQMARLNNTREYEFYFGANAETKAKAKSLRMKMTRAEKVLWKRLKGKKIYGLKFRRQHPVDIFILDFYCHDVRLAIEVDGEYHQLPEQLEWDENRTFMLNELGIHLIRLINQEVEKDMDNVIGKIQNKIEELFPSLPPQTGEEFGYGGKL